MGLELKLVAIDKPADVNVILGQSHFIKTVEDLYEALVGSVPRFPREMEDRIDAYLAAPAEPEAAGPVAEHRLGAMDRERTID